MDSAIKASGPTEQMAAFWAECRGLKVSTVLDLWGNPETPAAQGLKPSAQPQPRVQPNATGPAPHDRIPHEFWKQRRT